MGRLPGLQSMLHFAEISCVHNEMLRCANVHLKIVRFKCVPWEIVIRTVHFFELSDLIVESNKL